MRVVKDDAAGIDRPIICRHCDQAPCIASCPAGALQRTAIGGLKVDAAKCCGCGVCAASCPYNALGMHPSKSLPLTCDLCDGATDCAEACVTGALIRVEVE